MTSKLLFQTIYKGEAFSREFVSLNKIDMLVSLGKISSIRWDTLAFIKGGAMKGTSYGFVSETCYLQKKKANEIISSVLGDDTSVLDPGYYSKRFQSPMQNGWKWNPNRMDWGTDEDVVNTNFSINPRMVKYHTQVLIQEMPQEDFNGCHIHRLHISINLDIL